jgi:histidinol phosphatase-like enzyme (inositol monophosphatase family)
MSEATLLADVVDIARRTGDVALSYFGAGVAVELKDDGSPVTQADRHAESVARKLIASRYPDDGIVGEEFGASAGGNDRRWFLDPIDGTKSFVRGVPLWGTMVGVAIGGDVVAGAVYCPALRLLVAAAEGHGCTQNGRPCQVSAVDRIKDSVILATDQRFESNPARASVWQDLAGSVRLARTWGDCYGYLLIATGQAELMVDDRLSTWDAAPLLPIIREAGGVFTDWRGTTRIDMTDAAATNLALAAEFRARLGIPISPGKP